MKENNLVTHPKIGHLSTKINLRPRSQDMITNNYDSSDSAEPVPKKMIVQSQYSHNRKPQYKIVDPDDFYEKEQKKKLQQPSTTSYLSQTQSAYVPYSTTSNSYINQPNSKLNRAQRDEAYKAVQSNTRKKIGTGQIRLKDINASTVLKKHTQKMNRNSSIEQSQAACDTFLNGTISSNFYSSFEQRLSKLEDFNCNDQSRMILVQSRESNVRSIRSNAQCQQLSSQNNHQQLKQDYHQQQDNRRTRTSYSKQKGQRYNTMNQRGQTPDHLMVNNFEGTFNQDILQNNNSFIKREPDQLQYTLNPEPSFYGSVKSKSTLEQYQPQLKMNNTMFRQKSRISNSKNQQSIILRQSLEQSKLQYGCSQNPMLPFKNLLQQQRVKKSNHILTEGEVLKFFNYQPLPKLVQQIQDLDYQLTVIPLTNETNNYRLELGRLDYYLNNRASVLSYERRMKVAKCFYPIYQILFKLSGSPLQEALKDLENSFILNQTVRSGTLLSFFYLIGNYENPKETKNWQKSLSYLRTLSFEMDNEQTRGSNHKALVLFLLMQSSLIDNFGYFDTESLELFGNPSYVKKLLSDILNDFSSSTNQAIMINSFYLCQKLKTLYKDHNIDINQIWRQRALNHSVSNPDEVIGRDQLQNLLISQIPVIDYCNLRQCTLKLNEIAHDQSYTSIDYISNEVGHFLELYMDPDEVDLHQELWDQFNQNIKGDEDGLVLHEDLQLLNNLATNGHIDANLALFNLYYQGADHLGIDRNPELAQNYLQEVNHHIEQNGLQNLDPEHVYNLGYAELHNETQNMTRVLNYFQYAADQGEVIGLNALAYLYIHGFKDEYGKEIIKQNASYAIELLERASKKGNLEAETNLAKFYISGITDDQSGVVLLQSNISKAIEHLTLAADGNAPEAYHMIGELIEFDGLYYEVPQSYIELHNLTTKQKKCELSTDFFVKSVLRGFLKNWIELAQKRYQIQDQEGALLLYSYASLLGLPRGSYGAGYQWEMGNTGSFKCKIGSKMKCSLYYHINGFDYFKSKAKVADILSWKLQKDTNMDLSDLEQQELERVAFQLYEIASSDDGQSLYNMAQFVQNGKGRQEKNVTRALEIYDLLIERAFNGWYQFEEIYPAFLSKWALKLKSKFTNIF